MQGGVDRGVIDGGEATNPHYYYKYNQQEGSSGRTGNQKGCAFCGAASAATTNKN